MLERWIKHHQAIVGYENLIIIDNMSNDPAVIPAYEKYDGLITLFKYDTHFDLIHHSQHFPELYNALRECCDYFIFLDTDEYLIFSTAWTDSTKTSESTTSLSIDPESIFFPQPAFRMKFAMETNFQFTNRKERYRTA